MTDFAKELEAKAYQLCNGLMELEDFKSWFAIAMAAKTPQVAPAADAKRKDGEFSDYYKAPYEPMDDDMRKHHREMLGSGSEE